MPHGGGFSLLDYGCGLAHMKTYLDGQFCNVAYTGADAVGPFVDACKAKHPDLAFYLAQSPDQIPSTYDYVVASGVFNLLYVTDVSAHRDIVWSILEQLFERARVALAVDFMTDRVDFRQPGAYHQNVGELHAWIVRRLSRRLTLDHSYLPSEFSVTIWKDQRIRRPDSLYEAETAE